MWALGLMTCVHYSEVCQEFSSQRAWHPIRGVGSSRDTELRQLLFTAQVIHYNCELYTYNYTYIMYVISSMVITFYAVHIGIYVCSHIYIYIYMRREGWVAMMPTTGKRSGH